MNFLHELLSQIPLLPSQIPVIFAIVFMELSLSIDNILVLDQLVQAITHKDKQQQDKLRGHALWYGMLGAYLLRGLCLLLAAFIIRNNVIRVLGAIYLLDLTFKGLPSAGDDDGAKRQAKSASFWGTVAAVEIADLMFSIDNVAAAVNMSKFLLVVYVGVFIGIALMRFAGQMLLPVVEKYPALGKAAYLLIGWVAVQMLAEAFFAVTFTEATKMIVIVALIAASMIYSMVPSLQLAFGDAFQLIGQGMTYTAQWLSDVGRPVRDLWSATFGRIVNGIFNSLVVQEEEPQPAATTA